MIGSVNTPGIGRAEVEAMIQTAAATSSAVALDENSSVAFSLGCDDNGVYIVTNDDSV